MPFSHSLTSIPYTPPFPNVVRHPFSPRGCRPHRRTSPLVAFSSYYYSLSPCFIGLTAFAISCPADASRRLGMLLSGSILHHVHSPSFFSYFHCLSSTPLPVAHYSPFRPSFSGATSGPGYPSTEVLCILYFKEFTLARNRNVLIRSLISKPRWQEVPLVLLSMFVFYFRLRFTLRETCLRYLRPFRSRPYLASPLAPVQCHSYTLRPILPTFARSLRVGLRLPSGGTPSALKVAFLSTVLRIIAMPVLPTDGLG